MLLPFKHNKTESRMCVLGCWGRGGGGSRNTNLRFSIFLGGLVLGLTALRYSISVYIEPSLKERETEERKDR